MTAAKQVEVGDPFIINGHFACVTHVTEHKALIRLFADEHPYAMFLPQCAALVAAFDKAFNVPSAA